MRFAKIGASLTNILAKNIFRIFANSQLIFCTITLKQSSFAAGRDCARFEVLHAPVGRVVAAHASVQKNTKKETDIERGFASLPGIDTNIDEKNGKFFPKIEVL